VRRTLAGIAAGSVAIVVLLGSPAAARTEPAAFRCRLSATKLGSQIEVTFRLRSSEASRSWRVRMWNGGVKFADRTKVTDAHGALRVVASTRNRPGRDAIVAIARDRDTALRCEVELTI